MTDCTRLTIIQNFFPFSLLTSLLVLSACGSRKADLAKETDTAVVYKAGYRTISFVDHSRAYRPGVDKTDNLHFRPIDIDVWYPATPVVSDSLLRFGSFLQILENRANFYSAPQKFDSLPQTVAKSLCDGFACSKPDLVLQLYTATYDNPKPVAKRFPLIIYLASFGSMGYENYLLCESLAQEGYVVACVNSIGRYPGDMTMKNADLMEQVADAHTIINRLKKSGNIDTTQIGLLGYSWGGLAASLVAMQRNDIATVVSFDGSEFHHYGYTKSEDNDFDETANTSFFKNSALSIPYLRLESNPQPSKIKKDSTYNFLQKVNAPKQVIKIDFAGHQDFSSLPTAVRASGKCTPPNAYRRICALTISHFNEHLKSTFDASR